ncbi:MAG: NAD(P)/FAD-dependent oxidoreductase [Anaerolineales bacterium]|nr:MAG: NAD(P)/FAD-dependent oxidoreductase [Anaerolineales bacterium]
MSKSILIIGGGMAGLSAGCYAQMNGYRSQIFELHHHPGGLATSWKRGEYSFEAGVRAVTGTGPTSKVYQLWDELGLLDGRSIHYYDEFTRFEGADGRSFRLYTDIGRLEQHMLELAPQDRDVIEDLTEALRQFTRMELPVDLTPSNPLEFVQLGYDVLPSLVPVLRWRNVTVREFAARFRDPLLRQALPQVMHFAPADFPMVMLLKTLAKMNDREAGFPIGGSAKLGQDLAREYVALGGEIHCNARVDRILVEASPGRGRRRDRAVGLRLQDGTEHHGDIVISAADGRSTIFDLLEGRYVDDSVRSYYRDLPLAASVVKVSLGVARDMSSEPPSVDFPLREPIMVGNIAHDRLELKHYCFDPTMAPAGKSSLGIWCEADYDYWKTLRADREQYRATKQKVAEQVIAALDERYPGLRAAVEVVDVATPLSYERATANWRGAYSGWALTMRKQNMIMSQGMDKTLPGLDSFYMIGQWVEPGGSVDFSAGAGRDVIKDICRVEDRAFNTARLKRPATEAEGGVLVPVES